MKIDEALQRYQDLPLRPRRSFISSKLIPPFDKLVSSDSSISVAISLDLCASVVSVPAFNFNTETTEFRGESVGRKTVGGQVGLPDDLEL